MQQNQDQQGVVIPVELSQLIQQYILSVTATKEQPVAVATQILSNLQMARPIPLKSLQDALEVLKNQTPPEEESTFVKAPE